MNTAYRPTWATPHQPELGELVDGDLCDISVYSRSGRRGYCGEHAVCDASDVDGSTRILCREHAGLYFPHAEF